MILPRTDMSFAIEVPNINDEVPERRQSFPSEDVLSANIKLANGTDYSNYFIEQHYNHRFPAKRKHEESASNIEIPNLMGKEKYFIDGLRLKVLKGKKNVNPSEKDVPEIIDLSDSNAEKELSINNERIKTEDNSCKVINSWLEGFSDNDKKDSYSRTFDEKNVITLRQVFILDGLNRNKFKFHQRIRMEEVKQEFT